MASIGLSRTVAGVAVIGVIAGGIVATETHPSDLLAPVFVPVELTGMFSDASLMDEIGQLTGLTALMHFLDDPNGPLFPFVIAAEGLLEVFVVLPLLLVTGIPLVLLTDGLAGVQNVLNEMTAVEAGVVEAFEGIKDWYATHNAFTGALLDPPHDAAALSLADPAAWTAALDGEQFTAGHFDFAPVDFELGALAL